LYLLCYDVKYFEKIYGVIGNYLSVIDSMYGVRTMGANIANKYPNETMVILSKVLPEDMLNDTSIGLIDILDKIATRRFHETLEYKKPMDVYQESIKLNQEKKRAS
jgi:hypothetical protein